MQHKLINLQYKSATEMLIVSFTYDVTTDDRTVAYTGDQPVPRPSRALRGDPADDSVGPKNIPGYDRVVALANYLVTLKVSNFDDCNNFHYYYTIMYYVLLYRQECFSGK